MERKIGDDWTEVDSSDDSLLAEACRQLNDYFSGKRSSFDLPLGFDGTPFQCLAWQTLLTIPYERRSLIPNKPEEWDERRL